jgi:hypothetical protein
LVLKHHGETPLARTRQASPKWPAAAPVRWRGARRTVALSPQVIHTVKAIGRPPLSQLAEVRPVGRLASRGGYLTFVGIDGASGIRLCACRVGRNVKIAAPATRRSATQL